MKEKSRKRLFGGIVIAACGLLLAGCNSFCSDSDVSNFMYGYDTVNTTFFNSKEEGIDYIRTKFATLKTVDKNAVTDTKEIKILQKIDGAPSATVKEVLLTSENQDSLFGEFGNLYYFKKTTLRMDEVSKTEKDGKKQSVDFTIGISEFTQSLITSAENAGITTPSAKYFEEMDLKFVENVLKTAKDSSNEKLRNISKDTLTYENLYGYKYDDYKTYLVNGSNDKELLNLMKYGDGADYLGRNNALLAQFGSIKFSNNEDAKDHYKTVVAWGDELVKEGKLESNDLPTSSYLAAYKQGLSQKVNALQTCITVEDGFYGNVSTDELNNTVKVEGKQGSNFYEGWGQAFAKHGFLEGLLVYPIATLIENLSHGMGMNGVGQILAVLIVTVIVRLLFMLVSLPATISQQKMQYLQPELAKLQAKYPNSKENQYEKQKMAQAQMALYKKNHVHPMLSLLMIPIQFPVFICVWNAMRGSASLSSDAVLGLRLSDTIWGVLSNVNGWPGIPGWWTALVLIILMSAAQILSMFIPNILNKKRMKAVAKTGVNPAQDQNNKTMKITQWIMTIFIVIMGFTLPSAMGVYWFAGALFSIAQTVIMHFIFKAKYSKKG